MKIGKIKFSKHFFLSFFHFISLHFHQFSHISYNNNNNNNVRILFFILSDFIFLFLFLSQKKLYIQIDHSFIHSYLCLFALCDPFVVVVVVVVHQYSIHFVHYYDHHFVLNLMKFSQIQFFL